MASGQAELHLYLQALPSLSLAPEFHLLSDQWQQYILVGVGTLLKTVHEKDLGCRLLVRIIPKPPPPHLGPWKICLSQNQYLVPKRMEVADLEVTHLP